MTSTGLLLDDTHPEDAAELGCLPAYLPFRVLTLEDHPQRPRFLGTVEVDERIDVREEVGHDGVRHPLGKTTVPRNTVGAMLVGRDPAGEDAIEIGDVYVALRRDAAEPSEGNGVRDWDGQNRS